MGYLTVLLNSKIEILAPSFINKSSLIIKSALPLVYYLRLRANSQIKLVTFHYNVTICFSIRQRYIEKFTLD